MHISTKILLDYKRKIKEDKPSQRNCQNELTNPGLSHIEEECRESLIQGNTCNQQNSNEGFEYSYSQALESCNSKLSDLHAVDNMIIIHCVRIG